MSWKEEERIKELIKRASEISLEEARENLRRELMRAYDFTEEGAIRMVELIEEYTLHHSKLRKERKKNGSSI